MSPIWIILPFSVLFVKLFALRLQGASVYGFQLFACGNACLARGVEVEGFAEAGTRAPQVNVAIAALGLRSLQIGQTHVKLNVGHTVKAKVVKFQQVKHPFVMVYGFGVVAMGKRNIGQAKA